MTDLLRLNHLREIQVVELKSVKAIDTSLDPVGAYVGMRGSRVQAVVNEHKVKKSILLIGQKIQQL